jgi:hypothetical protein
VGGQICAAGSASASHENMDEKPDPAVSPAWQNKEENPPG